MEGERLPVHIDTLLSPSVCPHPEDRFELIQAHISYVFLAGDHVHKLKKPVDMGCLDYTALLDAPTGAALDYAVKMKRLPEERMIGRLLAENAVSSEMLALWQEGT